jgi:hypothetical protein
MISTVLLSNIETFENSAISSVADPDDFRPDPDPDPDLDPDPTFENVRVQILA